MMDLEYEKESSFLDGELSGALKKTREMAKKLRDSGVAIDVIAESSGLSQAEVLEL
ncbi:MAG: hypothetical protein J6U20_00625 [Fibrobacter sp.]|nr:hypothetical protein [Fibrobacter sp.]